MVRLNKILEKKKENNTEKKHQYINKQYLNLDGKRKETIDLMKLKKKIRYKRHHQALKIETYLKNGLRKVIKNHYNGV